MLRPVLSYLLFVLACSNLYAQVIDIASDTWVATDALGRVMPTADTNPLKTDKDRVVSIFYVTWHSDLNYEYKHSPYQGDVTRVLANNPGARNDTNAPEWVEGTNHWGEPEDGYFLSRDKYIIRKDMYELTDAGVDVLVLDCTNGYPYWDEWDTLFETMTEIKSEGNPVPKICFWCFNGNPVKCVTEIYERYYKTNSYPDLWFYWDGKPLMCYNDSPSTDANGHSYNLPDYPQEVRDFFTLRNFWWGYEIWAHKPNFGRNDSWFFGYELNDDKVAKRTPLQRAGLHNGVVEQMTVTPAQHSVNMTGKSWRIEGGEPLLNEYDMPDSAYVPWLGKTVADPSGYGIYFQDRWEEALEVDPPFIYLNDWNEWIAGKYNNPNVTQDGDSIYHTFMRRERNPFYFVDQYNAEFNRTIQPMKGGYTDNYYYQMVQNIRRYKGVRPIPVVNRRYDLSTVTTDWDDIDVIPFRDTRGEVIHRDYMGYGMQRYTNTSGRNDIVLTKAAHGDGTLNFYVECADDITPCTDNNWMLLLIDADCDASTGWGGYDYIVNHSVKSPHLTTLKRYDSDSRAWVEVAELPMLVSGNRLALQIPAEAVGIDGKEAGAVDFKWTDNPQSLADPIELCINGDTAPNRRFNYRYKWDFSVK